MAANFQQQLLRDISEDELLERTEQVDLTAGGPVRDAADNLIRRHDLVFWFSPCGIRVGRVMAFTRGTVLRLLVSGAQRRLGAWHRLKGLKKVEPSRCIRVPQAQESHFLSQRLTESLY